MFVEISIDDLIRVYRSASIGKLLGGLVHNINGPLQNLGMDLEMTALTSKMPGDSGSEESRKFDIRIGRMNEEFENIVQMVKTLSMRAGLMEEPDSCMYLDQFLDQELNFLKANLYFKHNVKTAFKNKGQLLIKDLPEKIPPALSWFLQEVVEDMERYQMTALEVEAEKDSRHYILKLAMEGNHPPSRVLSMLEKDFSSPEILKEERENMGLRLSLFCLHAEGASFSSKVQAPGSEILVKIPLPRESAR